MPTSAASREALLMPVVELARRAGAEILSVVRAGALGVREKSDASPVTLADLRSNEVLLEGLMKLSSEPIVSEESPELVASAAAGATDWSEASFWLVDPLDGTKDFVAGKETYVVNVALIERGRPVLGAIHSPALNKTYWACAGAGAFLDGRRIRNDSTREKLIAYASGSHMSARLAALLKKTAVEELRRFGSALKLCLVADGSGDLYPRFGRTSEWDTAAGHAILNEANCELLSMADGCPLAYGKPGFVNGGFLACRKGLDVFEAIRRAGENA